MPTGDLYICDYTFDRIYRKSGGLLAASAWDGGIELPTGATTPRAIAFDPDGNLYVLHQLTTSSRIYRREGGYSGDSWDTGIEMPRNSGNQIETGPEGICFDRAGNLYLVGTTYDLIYKREGGYDGASWDTGIECPTGVNTPRGIKFDLAGNLYVLDQTTDMIYKREGGYDGASWDAGIAIPSRETDPHDIAFDSVGDLYLTGITRDSVYRRVGGYDGQRWDEGTSLPASMTTPSGMAFDLSPAFEAEAGDPTVEMAAKVVGGANAPDAVTDLAAGQTRTVIVQQNISMIDDTAITDWAKYFFDEAILSDAIIRPRLPITAAGDALRVELSGGDELKCGQILFGLCQEIGDTTVGDTGLEGLDFSHVESNIYGDLITVERPATQIYRFDVLFKVEITQQLVRVMDRLRGGKRAMFIGSELESARGWVYGFLRDWKVYYVDGVHARARMTVQGVV